MVEMLNPLSLYHMHTHSSAVTQSYCCYFISERMHACVLYIFHICIVIQVPKLLFC